MSDSDGQFVRGQVKWFNPDKGWGFITLPGGGLDVFVHINDLKKSGIESPLNEGDKVRFETTKSFKGKSFATNILLVK